MRYKGGIYTSKHNFQGHLPKVGDPFLAYIVAITMSFSVPEMAIQEDKTRF